MINFLQRLKEIIHRIPILICVVMLGHGTTMAQGLVVKGHVRAGEDQSDLPGVNVLVKGTTVGTVTDARGEYSLEIPSRDAILVFSFIGYASSEVPVGERATIDVELSADVRSLDEVVVVGYGTQRKADLTGAVATFNTNQLVERPIARVDQALVGQMAGVRVVQTTGIPGRGFSIQVRGQGSLSANNEPLYVVDGFPLEPSSQNASGGFSSGNPLDNINPNDIESIQVLKDASAAAIYGSRASNGVVIIKTKSGQAGGKAKITFNAYTGVSQAVRKMDMMNSEQWIDRAKEIINGNWVNSVTNGSRTADQTTAQRQAILGTPGVINTTFMIDERWDMPGHPGLTFVDWQDQLFRTGVVQNYEATASGGNETLKYFVSGGYLDQDGVAIGLGYKRFSTRANIEVKANDKLKFGLNVAPSYSIATNQRVEGKDLELHHAVSTAPIVETSNAAGQPVGIAGSAVGPNANYAWGQNQNPIALVNGAIGDTKIFRTLSSIFGEYELVKNLSLRSSLNFDNQDGTTKNYQNATTTANRLPTASLSGFRRQNFVNENTLTYSRKIGNHSFTALAGQSYSSFKYDTWSITGSTFTNFDVTTLGAASAFAATNTESKSVLLSYFGRIQYSFNDKYLFSASIRRDGSSKFGASTKWGTFPSLSAGWRISEEDFLKNATNLFSDLKLRASWGLAGNNGIGDYASIGLLQGSNYSFGGVTASGQSTSNFPNPNLRWEKSETINVGIDIGVIQNRVHASFDYYTKDNTDLLLNIPVPTSSGFGTALTNVGRVLNKGWEVELHTRNLVGQFQWTTDINVSHNTNEVKKLGPNDTPIYDPTLDIEHRVTMVGQPIGSFYLVDQIGVLSSADIANKVPMFNTESAGDPKYLDANGDGKIDANDRTLHGGPFPKYIWGVTNTFKWKGFDLNVLVQGQNGGQIYSLFGRAVDRTGQGFSDNTLAKYADRWRSDANPGNGLHRMYSTFGRIKNTDWLYSSDYLRVRNITLGYNLASLLKSKVISGARVYVTAENWFGYDNYGGGFNPEAANFQAATGSIGGEDYGGFPLQKSLILGVNFTF
jgi:TonB-linked SusC/RagA family outer membrane protein